MCLFFNKKTGLIWPFAGDSTIAYKIYAVATYTFCCPFQHGSKPLLSYDGFVYSDRSSKELTPWERDTEISPNIEQGIHVYLKKENAEYMMESLKNCGLPPHINRFAIVQVECYKNDFIALGSSFAENIHQTEAVFTKIRPLDNFSYFPDWTD